MNWSIIRAILLSGLLLLAASPALAQRLVYEREFPMIAEDDNVLRVVVESDGSVTVERPGFMTRSGRYRERVPVSVWSDLKATIEGMDFSSAALAQDLSRRTRNEVFHVSDAEFSRFRLLDSHDEPLQSIEVESLQAYARRFDDARLDRLRQLEERILAIMADVTGAAP